MTVKPISSAQRAYEKFADYIASCRTELHITAADALVSLYKMRYPKESVFTTKLTCALQLKRIDIQWQSATS